MTSFWFFWLLVCTGLAIISKAFGFNVASTLALYAVAGIIIGAATALQ